MPKVQPTTATPGAQLASALSDGRARLEELTGSELATFAYPHGGWNERTVAAWRVPHGMTSEVRSHIFEPGVEHFHLEHHEFNPMLAIISLVAPGNAPR